MIPKPIPNPAKITTPISDPKLVNNATKSEEEAEADARPAILNNDPTTMLIAIFVLFMEVSDGLKIINTSTGRPI